MTFEEYREKYPEVHDIPKSWDRSFFDKTYTLDETLDFCVNALDGDIESFYEAFCWRTCPGHINWWMDAADEWYETGIMPLRLKPPLEEVIKHIGDKMGIELFANDTAKRVRRDKRGLNDRSDEYNGQSTIDDYIKRNKKET